MEEWSVLIEFGAPKRRRRADVVDDLLLGCFSEELDTYGGSVGGDSTAYSARIAVKASDAMAAAKRGQAVVAKAARVAGLPDWEVIECSVTRWEAFERQLAQPAIPELVGAAEAAEMLGVSRQRLTQLRRDNPDFPQALVRLAAGDIFVRAAIEKFRGNWERRNGRPPRRAAAAS